MNRIKKIIKKIIPGRILNYYQTFKLIPKYIFLLIKEKNKKYEQVNFFDNKETVDKIIINKMSMARFGDGEIRWMAGVELNSFQNYSDELANDLIDAFQSENPNLLIGIPKGIFDSSKCNLQTKIHWKSIKSNFYSNFIKFAKFNRTYCDASITRPYIDYKDREFSRKAFENLKRIWAGRNIVIVEGAQTKLGVGNDLFNNCKTLKRIICPSKNAYCKLEEIKESIRKNVDKNDLIITALGPTATILSSQICDEGFQIVDIGHIDIEYYWYLHNAKYRIPVPGKYVNECDNKIINGSFVEDENYLSSIIDIIK